MPHVHMRNHVLVLCIVVAGCSSVNGVYQPISHALSRPTPLSFGLYVTTDPENNPIEPPERFSGYHAAVDYEVSQQELETDVPIYAICGGEVLYRGFAEGYGGLFVHRCTLQGEDVTILYGHLSLSSILQEKSVQGGEQIGILAPARSYDSGWNRKHLHIGIHRGREMDLRGYVQSEEELTKYMDPHQLLTNQVLESVAIKFQPYWKEEPNLSREN